MKCSQIPTVERLVPDHSINDVAMYAVDLYNARCTSFGAVLPFVHSPTSIEMVGYQSLIDEYAASLGGLTGIDFQAEVCARLQTFIIGFQTVPSKPHAGVMGCKAERVPIFHVVGVPSTGSETHRERKLHRNSRGVHHSALRPDKRIRRSAG